MNLNLLNSCAVRPALRVVTLMALASVFACDCDDPPITPTLDGGADSSRSDGGFFCSNADSEVCIGQSHFYCEREGEFTVAREEVCAEVCVPDLWCVVCAPNSGRCLGGIPQICEPDGSAWVDQAECDVSAGLACSDGLCVDLCEQAELDSSYQGCEFFAVDLDNAAIVEGRDASGQQFAVVVSNPSPQVTDVVVEVNDAPYGAEPVIREILRVPVPPGDLEILRLPRREVDGSSSRQECFPDDRACPGTEVCLCSSGDSMSPCECRVSAESSGLNDGTHSAVTSQGYRIRSELPIIAYQFNPLDNVGVFSNDASLLIPSSAVGRAYTVVSWPQTIADGPDEDPSIDFNTAVDDEDLRASLTIVGTEAMTEVTIRLGDYVNRVMPSPPHIPEELSDGAEIILNIGPFDVINLETAGLNADFTGTRVTSNEPVAVFTGGEASDAPRFETYATRQCCADHLEEQLFPDSALGENFMIGRMPSRSKALNRAFTTVDSVAEPNEPEWVRVLAVSNGVTSVTTTLPEPDDRFFLNQRESIILRADQDFLMSADQPIAVLQVISSQGAVGIPADYPGGDPALIAVPPIEQYRDNYVFLTPNLYAFDFVTIMAPAEARVFLDNELVEAPRCTVSPADGITRLPGEPPPRQVIYRCQFSFPDVQGLPNVAVFDGDQNDGVHNIISDLPVGIIVYGFDRFVSYAYAGGLNFDRLN